MKNNLTIFDDGDFSIFNPFGDFFRRPVFNEEYKSFNNLMKTDIRETEKEYTLDIEMPGVSKQDISLDLNDGYLKISAETKKESDEKDNKGNYIHRERSYGKVSRSYFVGRNVKEEDIDAKLNNGVLNITIPKKDLTKEEHKKIEIK